MGFFSDLKEDLSQAVNELIPQEQQMPQQQNDTEAGQEENSESQAFGSVSEVSLEEMLKNIDNIQLPDDMMVTDETPDAGVPAQADESAEETDVATEVLEPEREEMTAAYLGQDESMSWMAAEVGEIEKEQADAEQMISVDPGQEETANQPTAEESSFGNLQPEEETQAVEIETEEPLAFSEGESEAEELAEARVAADGEAASPAGAEWSFEQAEAGMAEESALETEQKTVEELDMEEMLAQLAQEEPSAEAQEVPEIDAGAEYKEEVREEEVTEEVREEENQEEESKGAEETMEMDNRVVLDETSVITNGMVVTGDLSTQGSLDVAGTVNGNIDALGKLNITGHVNGNSKAAEIYAENAKINGEIVSEGAVKIESSTVIIGNITASSAAIAGAVKGDIDVKGPVILDASAIVMGNIKSKSVQINNGAVIEGMCSQCYADVNPVTFFDDYKPDIQTRSKSK